MEVKAVTEKILKVLKRYKFIVLILLVGFMLILLPEGKKKEENTQPPTINEAKHEISFEERLEEILTQIHGAGKVKVMLTISAGEEIVFQTNDTLSNNGESTNQNRDTVTVTDANRNQTGLIRKINPPIYQGAIIVCQGAENPTVKLAVTEAVSKVTGIGANCISVLKMK